MKTSISLLLIVTAFSGCDQINALLPSNATVEAVKADPNLVKTYYDDGKPKTEVRFDDKKRKHGLAKSFYARGGLRSEIYYTHGLKDSAVQYYENGNKYLEFTYKKGLRHGRRTKYWENGKVQSELDYRNDYPGNNLVEYNRKGKQLTKYPKLKVNQINNLNSTGEYIVEVYFDKRPSKATYYMGGLEDGFLSDKNFEMEKVNGRGRIVYRPSPGMFIMKKLRFSAKQNTYYASPYIAETSINLAIDF